MKSQAQIVKNSVNGLFVKGLIASKGWTKQQATDHVAGWLSCGKSVSFHDYMVEA